MSLALRSICARALPVSLVVELIFSDDKQRDAPRVRLKILHMDLIQKT